MWPGKPIKKNLSPCASVPPGCQSTGLQAPSGSRALKQTRPESLPRARCPARGGLGASLDLLCTLSTEWDCPQMAVSRPQARSPTSAGALPPAEGNGEHKGRACKDPGLSHRQTLWKGSWGRVWGGPRGLRPRGLLPWESMGMGPRPPQSCPQSAPSGETRSHSES